MALRRFAGRHRLVGIVVLNLGQGKSHQSGKLDRFGNGLGRGSKQSGHLAGGLQIPFAIGFEQSPRRLERDVFADAGDYVLQRAAFGRMIKCIVGGDERYARPSRHVSPAAQAAAIVTSQGHRHAKPYPAHVRQHFQQTPDGFVISRNRRGTNRFGFAERGIPRLFDGNGFALPSRPRRHHDQEKTIAPLQKVFQSEDAIAFRSTQFALAQ